MVKTDIDVPRVRPGRVRLAVSFITSLVTPLLLTFFCKAWGYSSCSTTTRFEKALVCKLSFFVSQQSKQTTCWAYMWYVRLLLQKKLVLIGSRIGILTVSGKAWQDVFARARARYHYYKVEFDIISLSFSKWADWPVGFGAIRIVKEQPWSKLADCQSLLPRAQRDA